MQAMVKDRALCEIDQEREEVPQQYLAKSDSGHILACTRDSENGSKVFAFRVSRKS